MLLRIFSTVHVVFYCHYPDLLLAKHDSSLRALYRIPLDFFEQVTTGMVRGPVYGLHVDMWLVRMFQSYNLPINNPQAHKVLVNSRFTADTFVRTFVPLFRGGMLPRVLYPAVNIESVRTLSGPMSLFDFSDFCPRSSSNFLKLRVFNTVMDFLTPNISSRFPHLSWGIQTFVEERCSSLSIDSRERRISVLP